jgi:hypothetical protein
MYALAAIRGVMFPKLRTVTNHLALQGFRPAGRPVSTGNVTGIR